MEPLVTSYQPLHSQEEDNSDETPQDHAVLIHTVPASKSRWNHIEDLDSFFFRVYQYHQGHGFACMIIQELLELFQFIYLVGLSTYLLQCLNFDVIFGRKIPAGPRLSFSDLVHPVGECMTSFSVFGIVSLSAAVIVWLLRAVKVVTHVCQYLDIKAFYNNALNISETELDNITWHEVQQRIREVQREQQMCIHKQDLTDLDIYHRLLRYKNYLVAMVNKSVLPIKFQVPYVGEWMFLSKGLKYNLEMLLFWGSWAPFENSWHLKEDYKKASKRKELASDLDRYILRISIANFVLSPLILLYQILYCFFKYTEILKREPGSLSLRHWSEYGKLYLRHFNELDHELSSRLCRAYRPARKYMESFTSPMAAIISRNIVFIMAAPFSFMVVLSIIYPDALSLDHLLTWGAILGAAIGVARCFIPDEHMIFCPEKLMNSFVSHAHYLPDHWRGQAHTKAVKNEFASLFPYTFVYLLEELLSPIITPFILCFWLRPRALELVDFFRNFTVEVVGVGDVCSFALMDVRRHGNPTWQANHANIVPPMHTNQYTQAEDGKTELSLMHFTLTNPHWKPPAESGTYISALKDLVQKDANNLPMLAEENVLLSSLNSLYSMGFGYSNLINSIWGRQGNMQSRTMMESKEKEEEEAAALPVRGGVNQTEGPLFGSENGLLASLRQSGSMVGSMMGSSTHELAMAYAEDHPEQQNVAVDMGIIDMTLSTLYLHGLHRRHIRRQGVRLHDASRSYWQQPLREMPGIREAAGDEDMEGEDPRAERMPLLDTRLAKSS